MRLPVVIALVAMILPPAVLAEERLRSISVTGTGTVAAAPDMANISAGVEARARSARDALKANSEAMAALLETLAEAGVESRDVQTSGLSLQPEVDHTIQSRPIIGYRATNSLSIRIRAIDTTGAVLDSLSQAGANRINAVSFAIAEPDPLRDEARRRAVADARRKAELYASEAGVSLGGLISLSEQGPAAPRPQMMEMARASFDAASVPIAEGELTIRASVSVIYEVVD